MPISQTIIKAATDAYWAAYGDGLSIVGVIRFYTTSRSFRIGDGVTNWQDLEALEFLWEKVLTTLYPITDNDNVNIGTGTFSGRKIAFDLTNLTAPEEGQMNWNSDDGTLQIGMPGGNVNLQIGQEVLLPRGKAIGSDIDNGQLVYISGASGSKPELSLAQANDIAIATGTIAMATEDILENQLGFYTSFGIVRDVKTDTFTAGDQIFLSATTAGGFTNVRPLQPNGVVCVGYVLYSHTTEGIVFINIDVKNPQFQEDGTLAAIGDATCWDDWKFVLSRERQGVASKPDYDFVNFGLLFPQNDPTEIAYLTDQCPHKRKAGSNFYPHIHWKQSQADVPTWKLEYRFLNNGNDSETAFTTITANAEVFTYTSGNIVQISTFPHIDGSAVSLSAMFEGRLYRDDNVVSGDVLAKEFDIHIEIDMLGSRQEFLK